MKMISLKEITQADLISSTLSASTEDEWDIGNPYSEDEIVKVSYLEGNLPTTYATTTAYSEDDRVIPTTENGYCYICVSGGTSDSSEPTWPTIVDQEFTDGTVAWKTQATVAPIRTYQCVTGNTGEYPPDDDGTYWLGLGASNKWKMFDQFVITSSYSSTAATTGTPSDFEIIINTNKMTELGLFNMNAKDIYVSFSTDNSTYTALTQVNYPKEVRLLDDYYPYTFSRDTKTWTDYLFGEFSWKRDILIPIPKRSVSYVKVKFSYDGVGEYAGCGMCVAGTSYVAGKTQYGAKSGILSYSRKETDSYFGYTYLKKGNYAKIMDIDVMVENAKFNKVFALLAASDGLPVILQGNNDIDGAINYEPFLIYGFVRSFDLVLEYPTYSECTIEFEGLI